MLNPDNVVNLGVRGGAKSRREWGGKSRSKGGSKSRMRGL